MYLHNPTTSFRCRVVQSAFKQYFNYKLQFLSISITFVNYFGQVAKIQNTFNESNTFRSHCYIASQLINQYSSNKHKKHKHGLFLGSVLAL